METSVDEPSERAEEADAPARRRRWPTVVAALVGIIVVAGLGLGWLVTHARQPKPASVSEAIQSYRASSTSSSVALSSGPDPGVFPAIGSGAGKLSIQSSAAPIGPTMPVTVTRDGATCWTFRIAYSSAHWQSWHYCRRGNRLLDLGGQVSQRFDFTVFHYDSQVTSVCDPVDVVLVVGAAPGTTWSQSCTSGQGSGASHQTGRATYLGQVQLQVGGRSVTCAHVRWTRTTSGAQTGPSSDEYWFDLGTYLPVQRVWSLTQHTAGPGGVTVTYEEHGRWQLTSLQPRS